MSTIKKCLYCGKKFKSVNKNQLYCSYDCRLQAMYKRNREKYVPKGREHEAICVVCGKSFISKAAGKYCSDECRKKAKLDRYKAYRKRFCKDFYEDDDLSTQEKTLSTNEKLLSTGRDIWSMVNAALEHHMSYGKYIEWLENGMNERRT